MIDYLKDLPEIVWVLLIIGFVFWLFHRKTSADKYRISLNSALDEKGIKTDARVVKIDRVGTGASGTMTFYVWTLEVSHPNGTKYEVCKNELGLGDDFMIKAAYSHYTGKVGAIIPIEFLPDQPKVIRIDEGRLLEYSQLDWSK